MYNPFRFCFLALFLCLLAPLPVAADNVAFEKRVYAIVSDLLHNHTYDEANLRVADSIYAESVACGSISGRLYANRLRMYVYVAMPDSAHLIAATDEVISLANQLQDVEAYSEAMNVKISFYMGQEHYFQAKQLTEEMLEKSAGSPVILSQSYSLMASIYQNRDMQEMAIRYYKKALEYVEENDSINRCLTYRSLAECYGIMDKHEESIDYARQALDMAGTDGVYYYWSAYTYLYTLFQKGDYDTFLAEYNRIRLLEQPVQGLLPNYVQSELLLRYELLQGHYDEALRLAESIEFKSLRLPAVILVYRMSGNWQKAVHYLDIYAEYEDSVRSQMAMENMMEVDAALGLDRLRMEKQELKERNQRIILLGILLFVLICLGWLCLLGIRRRAHIRQLNAKNDELYHKNEELNTKNLELARARDEAERSSQMKTHFIQNMSHEIRTPLHAISGFSQLLSGEVSADERQEYSQIIVNKVASMTTMLSDTLLLADLDAGACRVQLTDVPAVAPLRKAHEWARAQVPDGISLQLIEELDSNVLVSLDQELIRVALCKLIDNAIKFTQHGSIILACSLSSDGYVQYTVTDTGCGIPAESAERVFQRFAKVNEYVPGVGIGLTICREAMELMGGTVSLDTHYTDGARFVVCVACEN